MTNEQKEQVLNMRKDGCGYTKISQELGVSINTVSSFCRRNSPGGDGLSNTAICKQCGKPIKIHKGRKPRKFCSTSCRTLWWNSHLDQVRRKAFYEFTCAHCRQHFSAYGNRNRKYCSHTCYIADRFLKDTQQ